MEMNGVRDLNSAAGRGDGVAALFEAVLTRAGKTQLAGDATALHGWPVRKEKGLALLRVLFRQSVAGGGFEPPTSGL